MAETDCRGQVQACASRFARLDTNGVPLPGANNLYVSDALMTFGFTPVYTDGDEIEEKSACGIVGVHFRGPDTFKRGDVTLQFHSPDPFLSEFLSDGDVLTDASRPAGFAAPPIGPASGSGISIELWVRRILDGDVDPDFPWAHWAYPKIRNLRVGDHSHANEALKPTFSGQALENINWFDGPTGDWDAESDRVYQWIPTATIPTPSCGYIALAAS